MKIYKNKQGLLEISDVQDSSTVRTLFDAIDRYSTSHPLSCNTCQENCCTRRFYIEMDRISALHLCEKKELMSYIQSTLQINYPPDNTIQLLLSNTNTTCPYLNTNQQCSIYDRRPAACRFYSCEGRSERYIVVNRVVVAALHHALIADYFEYLVQQRQDPEITEMLAEPIRWLQKTPAYRKDSYDDILLRECIRFDMEGEDISEDEMRTYQELLTTTR